MWEGALCIPNCRREGGVGEGGGTRAQSARTGARAGGPLILKTVLERRLHILVRLRNSREVNWSGKALPDSRVEDGP